MAKYLVIVESPKKTGYIKKFLGSQYDVVASVGHIADLPAKGLNVDIKDDFKPTYAVYPDKKDVVKKIKEKAKKADVVYLMSDLDREGEAISWHIANILPKSTKIKRAVTASITKEAVKDAIKNAGDINMDMVGSYECRRILDRLCGYKASYPTKQATGGISAGRVQSAGLRILAEREKEIRDFVPQEYWPIEVVLEKKNGEQVTAYIKKPNKMNVKVEAEANAIIETLKKEGWVVSKYDAKEKSVRPYAPFTTSSLYQSASSILNMNSGITASTAQDLYEEGHITYLRSDSTFIIPEFVQLIRHKALDKYGSNYIPSKLNVFSNKKNAQEAHEAIRVTDVNNENVSDGAKRRLYEVIWRRTLACQMANMIQFVTSSEFTCDKYIYSAHGNRTTFDGWRKAWKYGGSEDSEIPEFKVGEKLKLISVKTEQKFTIPLPRYSEASFIKELEKRGIGRPSTYKSIIDILQKRDYTEIQKKVFHVTDMGLRVSDFLVDVGFCFVDLDFTKNLEDNLDRIAKDKVDKLTILNHFWDRLKGDIENAKKKREEASDTDYPCPKCDGHLQLKFSRYGPFYSCSNRTNKEAKCDYKCDIGKDGKPKEKEKFELEYSEFSCPNCGEPLLIRASKKNPDKKYLGCRNWQQKKCAGFYEAETGEKIEFKKRKFKKFK